MLAVKLSTWYGHIVVNSVCNTLCLRICSWVHNRELFLRRTTTSSVQFAAQASSKTVVTPWLLQTRLSMAAMSCRSRARWLEKWEKKAIVITAQTIPSHDYPMLMVKIWERTKKQNYVLIVLTRCNSSICFSFINPVIAFSLFASQLIFNIPIIVFLLCNSLKYPSLLPY